MPDVKYQGPVEMTAMLDHTAGPSLADQVAALPKKERIVQVCQSDQMFEWVHALATILIMSEKSHYGWAYGFGAAPHVAKPHQDLGEATLNPAPDPPSHHRVKVKGEFGLSR